MTFQGYIVSTIYTGSDIDLKSFKRIKDARNYANPKSTIFAVLYHNNRPFDLHDVTDICDHTDWFIEQSLKERHLKIL